jgi:Arc/MetJ-type ribon-helix-helix transcriptional regulator
VKQLQVEFPDNIADQIEAFVRAGWFQNEHELVRAAVAEFLRNRQPELTEQFQREDIAWAIQQTKATR